MISRITKLGALASKVWGVVNFILPVIRGIGDILDYLEDISEVEEDEERKKKAAIKIVMEIYDIIDDVTEEDLPIPRDTFENHLERLVDVVGEAHRILGVFRRIREGGDE